MRRWVGSVLAGWLTGVQLVHGRFFVPAPQQGFPRFGYPPGGPPAPVAPPPPTTPPPQEALARALESGKRALLGALEA